MNRYRLAYKIYYILRAWERKTRDKKGLGKAVHSFCERYLELCALYITRLASKQKSIFNPNNKKGLKKRKHKRMIVATLTSFPARINTVHIAIKTIMAQSVKPDKILLWLAKEQFPDETLLPQSLLELKKRGLEIRFCDDLKSHKKYYYAFPEFSEHLLATFDDDLLYPLDTLKKLYKLHRKYPQDTVCISAMNTLDDREVLPSSWAFYQPGDKVISSRHSQPFTGAGALFQPKNIRSELYDKERIFRDAPYADDLWLYYICKQSGIKVTRIKEHRPFPLEIANKDNTTLFDINGAHDGNMNDVQWANILRNTEPNHEIEYHHTDI